MGFLTKSWKTTLGSILVVLPTVLSIAGHPLPDAVAQHIQVIGAGFGLAAAKDSNVTGGTKSQDGGTVAADPVARQEAKK